MILDESPRVTVVMPAYKTSHTLGSAVGSVLKQTMQDFEIIIVEDHSQDDTLAVARALAQEDPRIRVVALNENGGQAHALNVGISEARGRWIATLDADDSYLEDRLAVLLEAGERENVDLVADNQNHVDETAGVIVRSAFPVSDGGHAITLQDFIDNNSTQTEFSLGILKPVIRRDFIRKHKLGYREGLKLGQDFYHLMQFFAAGGKGYLVHQPFYVWTLPFGPISREWTTTGLGAWRYDYSGTIEANAHFMDLMKNQGQIGLVALLERRGREYRTMMHYLAAQKVLAETRSMLKAAKIILAHPPTWTLLTKRITGRLSRMIKGRVVSG
jgi:succinoglycan biosynthesis protein ExoO